MTAITGTPPMDNEKAKILDAIIANHGAIIAHEATAKVECGCDPDVGYVCEGCALQALIRHLESVRQLLTAPAPLEARSA